MVVKRKKISSPSLQFFTSAVSCLLLWLFLVWLYGLRVILYPSEADTQADTQAAGITTAGEDPLEYCPVSSIAQLALVELHPQEGDDRHMVTPPADGKLTLVCCQSTKGNFSALLHHSWAPLGVERLVDMIRNRYFNTGIPLYRCKHASAQFGFSAHPNQTKLLQQRIPDDPPWLPPGYQHRQNAQGVKRYPTGTWTYAGAGPNSRSNQFVITLEPNAYMGGGSPWEVPLGELVGAASFQTTSQFYTGYGEKGPSQKIMRTEGYSEHVQAEWPLMDSILGCLVADEVDEEQQ